MQTSRDPHSDPKRSPSPLRSDSVASPAQKQAARQEQQAPTPYASRRDVLREFLTYNDEVSVSDAFGTEEELPPKVQGLPRFFGIFYALLFGGTKAKDAKLYPRKCAGIDRVMLLLICILACIGSVMVFSAGYAFAETRYDNSMYFIKKQVIFVGLGMIAMFICSRFTPAFYKMIARSAYLVTVLLLLAVLVFGFVGNGAQRWIMLGPISFQPSEVAKMTLVLMLAWYYSVFEAHLQDHLNKKKAWFYGIFYPFLLIGILAVLIMLEKHLSCLIIIGCIGLIVMYLGGSSTKLLGWICGGGMASVLTLALLLPYARRRLVIWMDPEKYALDGGWQTLEGLLAIGSGGIFGLGLGNSRMKHSYVPEPANDFIFTITCEELGFIGAAAILILFAIFVVRGYTIGMHCEDTFSKIAAMGITTKVAVQVLLNIGVVTNMLPNTGIALPFFSYGGSSLVILFAEMGILLSISRSAHLKFR